MSNPIEQAPIPSNYEAFRKETERQFANEARLSRRPVTNLEPVYKSMPNQTFTDRAKRLSMRIASPV